MLRLALHQIGQHVLAPRRWALRSRDEVRSMAAHCANNINRQSQVILVTFTFIRGVSLHLLGGVFLIDFVPTEERVAAVLHVARCYQSWVVSFRAMVSI